jgi:hypothetical protein
VPQGDDSDLLVISAIAAERADHSMCPGAESTTRSTAMLLDDEEELRLHAFTVHEAYTNIVVRK